ncbi:MAG TPA: DinB family protein [Burkholderiales bacterium]|nr:DinB family protein [Burkholderiales bacterium]
MVLRAVQRYLRQMPTGRINENVIDNRQRSIRLLGHHVFRIGEAYLESVIGGVEYAVQHANVPPKDGTYLTGAEIAGYGEQVISRLQKWWDGLEDKSLSRKIKTYYGMQPIAMVFERSTWHSAQHARQLIHVLERFGIEPDGRLTTEDLAGLPLPERLFE